MNRDGCGRLTGFDNPSDNAPLSLTGRVPLRGAEVFSTRAS